MLPIRPSTGTETALDGCYTATELPDATDPQLKFYVGLRKVPISEHRQVPPATLSSAPTHQTCLPQRLAS